MFAAGVKRRAAVVAVGALAAAGLVLGLSGSHGGKAEGTHYYGHQPGAVVAAAPELYYRG